MMWRTRNTTPVSVREGVFSVILSSGGGFACATYGPLWTLRAHAFGVSALTGGARCP
jgi:hypothetical protein